MIWQIRVDTGGTFTDCIAIDPDGELKYCKVLSSGALRDRIATADAEGGLRLEGGSRFPPGTLTGFTVSHLDGDGAVEVLDHGPQSGTLRLSRPATCFGAGDRVELRSGEEAPLLAARLITGTPLGSPLPTMAMRLATTRGTNALLERCGARTVHLTSSGFEDLLHIGDQQRPDLFALHITKEHPLPELCVSVNGRIGANGEIIESLDREAARDLIDNLRSRGFDCASIALMNAYRNPEHELQLERLLIGAGFAYVARSSDLSPCQGLLRRAETAAVDAYLGPVIDRYLEAVRSKLDQRSTLHVMTSAGGLTRTEDYRPMHSLLSGPAGGVVGAAMSGLEAGSEKVIAFDMGGTSTDVSRYDGDFDYVYEHRVGAARLAAPALAIETVAAGGGSVCRVEQGRLVVGPESAGAHPGPAAYGAGGPLTLTDVNLLLGRLVPERFPIPIDTAPARRRLTALAHELGADGDEQAILEGLLRIADERMAEAIRQISVRQGVDPAGYALVAFGGAGGQHACRIAEILDMGEVILPAHAGLLSAVGLGHATLERFAACEVLRPWHEAGPTVGDRLAELEARAVDALVSEGVGESGVEKTRRFVELRYTGQDSSLEIEVGAGIDDPAAAFEDRYAALFSYRPEKRGLELVSLRVVAHGQRATPGRRSTRCDTHGSPIGTRRCFLNGAWREVPCFEAATLAAHIELQGPALIHQAHSTLVVPTNWSASGLEGDGVRLTRIRTADTHGTNRPAAVELELMSHRFAAIAREMGALLKRTAISTNIKEREDFSCTLLDSNGRLVVNAPHIPVHLGAMGLCVRAVATRLDIAPGDVAITNHPDCGGSHLPDVTLVAPVHTAGELIAYVACRAHHAEIGGIRPGSVPNDARSLAEEGVIISPTRLVAGGEPRWADIGTMLTSGPHPSRMPEDNLADLRAMLAAINRGRQGLEHLTDTVGRPHVLRYMDALRTQAERQTRRLLSALPDGERFALQRLDDGSEIRLRLLVDGERARLDFTGSAGVHAGNLNATPAIVHSAVVYVMRLLVQADIPLNEGLLQPIDIVVPTGLLNPTFDADPQRCPAVVGGNVETSQRLVDTLLEAFGVAACSQGTMNNLSFGNRNFGYYETIGGGSGAVEGHAGVHGVHTHMTNTRITDPEVLEHRYPIRLHRFAIRRGSGGRGRWRGGDGLIRDIEFLDDLEVSILSQHRIVPPYGAGGGEPGEVGRQALTRASGEHIKIGGIGGCAVGPGDRLVVETPGGGGFGNPSS